MTIIRLFAMAAALCAVSAMTTTTADAAKKKKKATDIVVVSGCTKHVDPACLGLTYRGTTYVLFSATHIPMNTGITVLGRRVGGMSFCPEPRLQVISWKPNGRVCTQKR